MGNDLAHAGKSEQGMTNETSQPPCPCQCACLRSGKWNAAQNVGAAWREMHGRIRHQGERKQRHRVASTGLPRKTAGTTDQRILLSPLSSPHRRTPSDPAAELSAHDSQIWAAGIAMCCPTRSAQIGRVGARWRGLALVTECHQGCWPDFARIAESGAIALGPTLAESRAQNA